jgi:hypothetical protein
MRRRSLDELRTNQLSSPSTAAARAQVDSAGARQRRKWDKKNRRSLGSATGADPSRLDWKQSTFFRKTQSQENKAFRLEFLECDSKGWPVITDNPGVMAWQLGSNAECGQIRRHPL